MPITALAEGSRKYAEVVGRYPALAPGNLFETPDLLALPLFDGGDELSGVEKGVEGSGIEPGKAPSEQLHLEGRTLQYRRLRSVISSSPRADSFTDLAIVKSQSAKTSSTICRLLSLEASSETMSSKGVNV